MTLRPELLSGKADSTPLYVRLAALLREQLRSGAFAVGEALPSERQLSEQLGVSRVTVRKALELLMREGVLSRKQGSGTFVAPRIEQPSALLAGFSADLARRGMTPGSVWLEKTMAPASSEDVLVFGLPVASQVARFLRIRTANDEPLALEQATVPARFLPDLSRVGMSLYDALDKLGNKPVTGLQRITASLATEEEAGHLCVPPGAAILRIERRGYLRDGTMVEFTRSAYRGDRYDFVSELREL
ncbi:GntR family transcriptional regulator [Roseibaca sp. V10]|uniref:GntR family transcriptional regulator n=1 Tax=Roseinatronobacter domitianus TaxID=2940293 RepID=A0ABT0M4S7_9RHOB|nr:GntR family transcriptional regulator [Roseibaca domitiana]MCL1629857.1 GntR family transcriptional regulator [Roseibaca domitiana]